MTTTNTPTIDSMRKIYDHVWHWIVKQTYEITDSPINSANTVQRKVKTNGNEHAQQTKSCQNMKSILVCKDNTGSTASKRVTPDYSDMERNNIYAETPSKVKINIPASPISPPTLVNGTNHYMPILQQRRGPTVPTQQETIRHSTGASTTSVSSFSTATCSSQSTTPSNSYRQDSSSIMTRSADASAVSGLTTQTKSSSNNLKSKSTYDIDTSTTTERLRLPTKDNLNTNSKCPNTINNGNFVPLQCVKEDECLEVDRDILKNSSKNDDEQQRILMDLLKHKHQRQTVSSSSAVSTPMMPRNNSPHQRSSSTDPTDDEYGNRQTNGFTRGHRIRSSLPFIIKPAVNSSKSNSLGLCFLICGEETKKVLLPSYISCLDTLKALFVRAFPHHLTMKQMDTDDVRIYIREPDKDIFYQLEDISDVKDRSVLKVVQLSNNAMTASIMTQNKPQISTKHCESDELSMYVPFTSRPSLASEITYQRLSRLGRVPSTTSVPSRNESTEDAHGSIASTNTSSSSSSTSTNSTSSSRSLSEPRRRAAPPSQDTSSVSNHTTSNNLSPAVPPGIISTPRSGSTTPTTSRLNCSDEDARQKMVWMEKQLESLTELVRELTRERAINEQTMLSKSAIYNSNHSDIDGKSLRQQLYELKVKTHTLRNELVSVKRMQQTLQESFKMQLENASKKIEDQILRLHQSDLHTAQYRTIENELDLYMINSAKIDRDLEDLEASVEELQNDVKSKQCYVTMNDVESFALVLSTISRSLVDLKASFPILREKICSMGVQSTLNDDQKFLKEEPERLDFTIKKCKRLTTMLYQLKRLAVNQEQRIMRSKSVRHHTFGSHGKAVDRKRLLEQIETVSQNSEGRLRAIEKSEKLRTRRLQYSHQLETLKHMKQTSEQLDGNESNSSYFDTRSITQSVVMSSSTRTSICSTQSTTESTALSNNCPSPSLSYIVRQALISPTNSSAPNGNHSDSKGRCQTSTKGPSKVTFSQQLITNGKTAMNSRDHSTDSSCLSNSAISMNKKNKPTPPPRIQSTSSSSAVSSGASCSSSSSSSTSSNGSGNSRLSNGFCGIIPLVISPDRRHSGRCNSFSSSSTDTDSVISNPRLSSSHKSPTVNHTKSILTSNGFHTKSPQSTNPSALMRASVTDL